MLEKEIAQSNQKLVERVSADLGVSDVAVSFPERWEFVTALAWQDAPLYVAPLPSSEDHPSRNHFPELSADVNLSLTDYRLYKFYRPWPMPRLFVSWDSAQGRGRVTGVGESRIQLHSIGQAQVWKGKEYGVLWECYLFDSSREANWERVLTELWGAVEQAAAVQRLYTPGHEPAFETGYLEFLSGLGYLPLDDKTLWWVKDFNRTSVESV